jgi:hypothetical protein
MTTTTRFEIAEDIKYNFPPLTNKNIFIPNLSPEAIEDLQNYLKSKWYIKDNIIISDYYQSNENRYIINPEDKFYPIHIPDRIYIEFSDLGKTFTKDIVDGKYKDILINPYRNYLIVTNNGEPKKVIFQSPKDKSAAELMDLKTFYFNFTLENKDKKDPTKKLKVILAQRLIAMMFIMNPNINEKVGVGHLDRNRWNNNINNLEWQTQLENNNKGDIILPSNDLINN